MKQLAAFSACSELAVALAIILQSLLGLTEVFHAPPCLALSERRAVRGSAGINDLNSRVVSIPVLALNMRADDILFLKNTEPEGQRSCKSGDAGQPKRRFRRVRDPKVKTHVSCRLDWPELDSSLVGVHTHIHTNMPLRGSCPVSRYPACVMIQCAKR